MNHLYTLEGGYLIATPAVSHAALQGALVYVYQVEDEVASGLILNKPHADKTLGDFLAYPQGLKDRPVWLGGPLSKERVIAFYQNNGDIYITDRLSKLSESQLAESLFLSGQCVWSVHQLSEQIQSGEWMLVGSNVFIPNLVPAEDRIEYVLSHHGINLNRLVYSPAVEAV